LTAILLDQNVPGLAKAWLLSRHPDWLVLHASDLGSKRHPMTKSPSAPSNLMQ